jgi:putative endonuclease
MVGSVTALWLNLERTALRGLETFGSRFGPARRRAPHLRTGLRGETEALFFLRHLGYTIVARRWRCTEERGDLDLVAWDGDTLAFIEVKSRSTRDPLLPAEASVDRDKQRMLRAMAFAYLRRQPREQRETTPIRFDIVSVYFHPTGVQCELLRDAFATRRPVLHT